VNRSTFIPYEAIIPGPEQPGLDLIGYPAGSSGQLYFNGETEIKSENTAEINVTLHCIQGGAIGTALFKYLIMTSRFQPRSARP